MLFHNIFQSYAITTLSHKTQFLRHVTAFSNIPACSCLPFFEAQELTTLFRSVIIPSKTFSSQAHNIFFQLTKNCLLHYSMAFQHILVILINNLVGQTTDKFRNLISIFKTQRKSSVTNLKILKSTAPGLTDFPLLLNHDVVFASLFYSPLFCSIKYLAILSTSILTR